MAKVLTLYALTQDLPALFRAIAKSEHLVWHWLAEGRGFAGPGMGTTDSVDALPDPFQHKIAGMDLCATLPGVDVEPRGVAMANGGERFVLNPVDIGDSLWFQGLGLGAEARMIRPSRLFVHGREPRLHTALRAAEKHLVSVGVRPFVMGKVEPATWVLPNAVHLARSGWRMNRTVQAPDVSDCVLPD